MDELNPNYRKYISYSEKRLHEYLNAQRDSMSELLRTDILQQVSAEKKRLRSVKAQKKMHDATWREFMRPLMSEIRIVQNMARYISKSYKVPERTAAIYEYRHALLKLKGMLLRFRDTFDSTPLRLAREKNVPNDGKHWVDWVPVHVRESIEIYFANIPHNHKAKIKVPFERRNMDDTNAKKRIRLARTIDQELEAAYKDIANEPLEYDNPDQRDYIARLELAKQAVIALADDAHVPATWQGLFTV
jgi:hypothetical protein